MRFLIIFLMVQMMASAQTPPLPVAPKIWGAQPQLKGAERQLLSVAEVIVVVPRTITLMWDDVLNPEGTTYNVYHSLIFRGPMSLLTNTPLKQMTLPANKPQEWFGVKAITPGLLESGWATK